jgi:UDP-2-acetamido-3-amino-2,3-dideoxy-glucuronate N-acetyltransferase
MIHETAVVDPGPHMDGSQRIWHWSHVMGGASIGRNVIIGQGCFVDSRVVVGDNCKLQNGVMLYHGVTLEDGVFMGPCSCTTNDRLPRAINPDGTQKSADDWTCSETLIKRGASIGANATIRCGVTIGRWAMVGAGAVVTRNVPDHGLVVGNPARLVAFVCHAGHKMPYATSDNEHFEMWCRECGDRGRVTIPRSDYALLVLR